ncbi:urea ABC transporter ATP-binding subunit UrtE [Marivita sp.]|uniref:urea ABC transporter ATP-binding subunit UrtE n=1 Tax=Marivita sp. TaxID=2003365 RepID=UPI0025C50BFE|nr:urea ABC transporter ATP-binding subunit UrtE [Marivita sp.]
MLSLNKVTSFYSKTPILQDISLKVEEGKCLCVLGRNGVGKTTLMQTIMGLTTRATGEIRINGTPMDGSITAKRAIAGLGYVPQGRRIFGKFTVRENIKLGTFARTDGSDKIPDLCLELFPYLADNLDKRAGMLSGGQQQQLAIARALITKPKLLLLDEPTEGIQPNIIQQIGRVIALLREQADMAIVLVEQYFSFAYDLGDRFYVLERGAVKISGPKADLDRDDLLAGVSV